MCQVQGHHEQNMQSLMSRQDAGVERSARKKPWRLEGQVLEKQDKTEKGRGLVGQELGMGSYSQDGGVRPGGVRRNTVWASVGMGLGGGRQ